MTTFHTNCTLPNGVFNYVAGPNIRGTLQILWSSLSALILCTWAVQHLNVPLQSSTSTEWQGWTRRAYRFTNKVKWMLVTLLAPELLFGKAYSDFLSAKRHLPEYEATAEADGVPWSLSHCFLANMGGFVIKFNDKCESGPKLETEPASIPDRNRQHRQDMVAEDGRVVEGERLASSRAVAAPLQPEDAGGGKSGEKPSIASTMEHPRDIESQKPVVQADGKAPKRSTSPPCFLKPKQPPSEHVPNHESQVLKRIEHMRNDPATGSEAFIRSAQKQSHAIGKLSWIPDAKNAELVNSALDQTHLLGFATHWEETEYFVFTERWYLRLMALQGNIWSLDACQLYLARKMGIIERLPCITEDEVDDRSKGDAFIKGLAILQVIWLFVQAIVRGAAGLPPSQLEISVLAFALCAFGSYILLWKKPQDFRTPVYINASRRPSVRELGRLAIIGPDLFPQSRQYYTIPEFGVHCDGPPSLDRIVSGAMVAACAFGAVHCAAWNLQFPTAVESLLWKIAALVTTGIPPVSILLGLSARIMAMRAVEKKAQSPLPFDMIFNILVGVFYIPYVVARLYITVELFRSLCYLDPKTFSSTWVVNVPHLS